MNGARRTKKVIVAGDVTIDWNIARLDREDGQAHGWNKDSQTHAFCQKGGAALLVELLEAVADTLVRSKLTSFEVRKMSLPVQGISPGDERFHHSYSLWKPFKMDTRVTGSQMVWRVSEFLGIHRARSYTGATSSLEDGTGEDDKAAIIILNDADLGFRDHPESWPKGLYNRTSRPWILLKMAPPLAMGELWNYLQKDHSERVIALVTADDLRRHASVQVSRQISWERTAQDLVWELLYNPRVNGLAAFAHTIVSFDMAGALLLTRKSRGNLAATLLFDTGTMEGEWRSNYPGGMVGYTSCLAAGIARELLVHMSKPDIQAGIQAGVDAMRHLHIKGYGDVGPVLGKKQIAFPASTIAVKILEGGKCLASVNVSNPAERLMPRIAGSEPESPLRSWTILETQTLGALEQIAGQIVREGLGSAFSAVPVARYGNLVTVDSKEIEALNCIGSLLIEYYQQPQKNPLSIAVFGPPGAGKSFAVKQVANSVRPGDVTTLTFNVSQLSGTGDLINAFHQIRDIVLSGKTPLVFWDEFDTELDKQPLRWLRYFLAPMQDGEFQEGQVVHSIGKSVFVFAGGTSHNMNEFAAKLNEPDNRDKKLPDFISRLRGFLDILGPNPQGNSPDDDPYYVIRRAILLRSLLERHAPQISHESGGKKSLDIDDGVLRAFLLTGEYRHGARSMEGIVLTSRLYGKTSFERSSLPTETQLNLYVNGREFYSLVHLLEPDEELLENLAEAAHEIFCEHLKEQGYKYGPETREEEKVHSSLRRYQDLPEHEKEQNRGNVRDIPNKLARVGCAMIPAKDKGLIKEFTENEYKTMAMMEHQRWMQVKFASGWSYAKKTNKLKKQNKLLVPWDELPPEEQEKDYVMVRGIPKILFEAGYTLLRLSD